MYIKTYRYVCMILKAAIVAYIASRLLCTRYRVYVSPAERIVTRLVVGRDATEATAGPGRREGPRSAGKRAQPAEQAAAGMPMARRKATRSIKERSTYTRTRVTVHKTIATKLCKEKVGKRNFTAAFRTALPFYSEICTGIQCSVFTYAGRDERGDNCSIQYSSILEGWGRGARRAVGFFCRDKFGKSTSGSPLPGQKRNETKSDKVGHPITQNNDY